MQSQKQKQTTNLFYIVVCCESKQRMWLLEASHSPLLFCYDKGQASHCWFGQALLLPLRMLEPAWTKHQASNSFCFIEKKTTLSFRSSLINAGNWKFTQSGITWMSENGCKTTYYLIVVRMGNIFIILKNITLTWRSQSYTRPCCCN